MLSICIPIYNYNCTELLGELIRQSQGLNGPVEICCIDDASTQYAKANESFIYGTSIRYKVLDQNIGRSRIRNQLAEFARHSNLLFLDCDVQITEGFLNNYVEHFDKPYVVYGGTQYSNQKPENKQLMLHYYVGKVKESLPVKKRLHAPYLSFKTNNFLVPRSLIQEHPLDETLSGYGHEDTLWAFTLKSAGISLNHIANPIIHQGLEENHVLLKKIENSLDNLISIEKRANYLPVKVSRVYRRYRPIFKILAKSTLPKWFRNQLLNHPSLLMLDLYKLMYLARTDAS